VVLVAMKGNG